MLFFAAWASAASPTSTTLLAEARAVLPECTLRMRGEILAGRCAGKRFTVDTHPVVTACANGEPECERGWARAMADLAFTYGDAQAMRLSHVVPVVRDRSTLDGMLMLVDVVRVQEGRDVSDRAPVHTPFGADVEVLYMVDGEAEARAMNAGELDALHLEATTLHAATAENVTRMAGEVRVDAEGPFERWEGSYYLSSLVLDLPRWAAVAGDRPLLLTIPSSDTLLLSHSADPMDVALLELHTLSVHQRAHRPVSLRVFYWTGTGWVHWTGAMPGPIGAVAAEGTSG